MQTAPHPIPTTHEHPMPPESTAAKAVRGAGDMLRQMDREAGQMRRRARPGYELSHGAGVAALLLMAEPRGPAETLEDVFVTDLGSAVLMLADGPEQAA